MKFLVAVIPKTNKQILSVFYMLVPIKFNGVPIGTLIVNFYGFSYKPLSQLINFCKNKFLV